MVKVNANEEQKELKDYFVPLVNGIHSMIRGLAIQANNCEIKLAIIQMILIAIQFEGLPNDDLNLHLTSFFGDL